MAAHKSEIDMAELEKLASLQCTQQEIAAWFGVCTRTIERRCQEPEFSEVMERGRAKGRISVRRMQMKLLEQGNATMGVWLGKQLLGQRDQVVTTEVHPRPGLKDLSTAQLTAVLMESADQYPEVAAEIAAWEAQFPTMTPILPRAKAALPAPKDGLDR